MDSDGLSGVFRAFFRALRVFGGFKLDFFGVLSCF